MRWVPVGHAGAAARLLFAPAVPPALRGAPRSPRPRPGRAPAPRRHFAARVGGRLLRRPIRAGAKLKTATGRSGRGVGILPRRPRTVRCAMARTICCAGHQAGQHPHRAPCGTARVAGAVLGKARKGAARPKVRFAPPSPPRGGGQTRSSLLGSEFVAPPGSAAPPFSSCAPGRPPAGPLPAKVHHIIDKR